WSFLATPSTRPRQSPTRSSSVSGTSAPRCRSGSASGSASPPAPSRPSMCSLQWSGWASPGGSEPSIGRGPGPSSTTGVRLSRSPLRHEVFVKILPSILAADYLRLGEQIADAERGGADRFHIDVMDGMFVPNLSLGIPVIEAMRRGTKLPLEIHLMIERP